MISDEVFHYTKRETAIEKILLDRQIKFGQIGFTNDPRESKERFFSLMYSRPPSGFRLRMDQMTKMLNRANTLVGKEWKVLCVSQHHPTYDGSTEITSVFLRGDCRPRMWATYAENHRGVCLRLNRDRLNQRLKDELTNKCKVFCGAVTYDDLKSVLPLEPIDLQDAFNPDVKKIVRDYCIEHWGELFLVKSKDWESEFEFRWLIHSTADSPLYIPVEGILEGILVGQNFPKVYLPSLIELCKGLGIPVGMIDWRSGLPQPQYGNIYKP